MNHSGSTIVPVLSIVLLPLICIALAAALQQAEAAPAGQAAATASTIKANTAASEPQGDRGDPEYWKKRKDWFYRRTRFNLTDENLRLIGAKRLMYENKSAQPIGHLPFWFDYELFKEVFNKQSADEREDRERQHAYVSTCVRVLRARVLFRMLAGTSDTFITEDADKFHWEKYGPLGVTSTAPPADPEEEQQGAEIAVFANFRVDSQLRDEAPLDRAIRLVSQEMQIVESKNQVETNLRAFNEVDGSAIAGKLPY